MVMVRKIKCGTLMSTNPIAWTKSFEKEVMMNTGLASLRGRPAQSRRARQVKVLLREYDNVCTLRVRMPISKVLA
ncbi:hypothetical protein F8388_020663 [Cannabis sativa]|uniref:Uncharacterized protein n=1 Tax=Cannabis sativa TaxID=3483 RepID=A0A7J6F4Y0_CANSA|nr:hypothetical protein F8388_020663 [Cannabis sativa]